MYLARILRPRFAVFAVIYGPTLIILLFIAVASVCGNIEPAFFCRDPTATLHAHPLTGMQSNISVLAWCVTTTVCIFSHVVLRFRASATTEASFFLWAGLLTFMITIDDLFLIHEDLLHRYFGSWIYGKLLYICYALFSAWFLIRFRRIIIHSEFLMLLLAYLFFAAALMIDIFDERWLSPWRIFFEDGFKLLGIVSWGGYLIRLCFRAIQGRFKEVAGQ